MTDPGNTRGARKLAPGKAKRDRQERAKAVDADAPLAWFAVAAPGLGAALADELQTIAGVNDVRAVDGGVELSASVAGAFAVNLRSRIATRVLLRLGTVDAREFPQLRRRAGQLAFEHWLGSELPLRIDVATSRCRLYHTAAIAETVLLAASDRIGTELHAQRSRANDEAETSSGAERADDDGLSAADTDPGNEPFARVLVRGHKDRFTISLDSSGALLHRRGARLETGRAPLRETLAAGMLRIAGYRGDEPLVNAMCGAGTIALEAAAIALEHAPGRQRSFALERFPLLLRDDVAREALEQERTRARSEERSEPRAPLFAFDRDLAAVERAQRNAQRAGLANAVTWQRANMSELAPPCERGLLIANPPYGRRIGNARSARAGYGELVRTLRERWRGFRVALLVPRDAQPPALGLRGAEVIPLLNGGIPVNLIVAQL